jgi:hypothetical protein
LNKIFALLLAPVSMTWAVMESQLWLSLAVLTALTVGCGYIGQAALSGTFALLLGMLLMRADAILAPAPAEPPPLQAD